MGDHRMNDDEFTSIGELLVVRRISTAVLATAIEKHGLDGWDQCGRFRHFGPNTEPDVPNILKWLAEEWKFAIAPNCGHAHVQSPAEAAYEAGDSELDRYGWLTESLPDFEAIEASASALPSPPTWHSKKAENASLGIIGALLGFIRGDFSTHPHPDWQSQTALVDLLADACEKKVPGVSRSNLEKHFAKAKQLLKDRLDE
jgi:hypothetical protein